MLKYEKEQYIEIKQTHYLYIGSFKWDIGDLTKKLITALLLALTYNVAIMDAQNYLMWTAYFSQHNELCDYSTGLCVKYTPQVEGKALVWKSEIYNISQSNNTLPLGFK